MMYKSAIFDYLVVCNFDKKKINQISDLIFDYSEYDRTDVNRWLIETSYRFKITLYGYKTRITFENKQGAMEFKLRYFG